MLEVRWARREEEQEWEAVAGHPGNDAPDETERQLALACKLCSHMLVSEHIFYSMLRIIGDELKQAAHPAGRRRPRPDSTDWWRRRPHQARFA